MHFLEPLAHELISRLTGKAPWTVLFNERKYLVFHPEYTGHGKQFPASDGKGAGSEEILLDTPHPLRVSVLHSLEKNYGQFAVGVRNRETLEKIAMHALVERDIHGPANVLLGDLRNQAEHHLWILSAYGSPFAPLDLATAYHGTPYDLLPALEYLASGLDPQHTRAKQPKLELISPSNKI